MTLSQGYRMAQAVKYKQPCLDYPLWEQVFEHELSLDY